MKTQKPKSKSGAARAEAVASRTASKPAPASDARPASKSAALPAAKTQSKTDPKGSGRAGATAVAGVSAGASAAAKTPAKAATKALPSAKPKVATKPALNIAKLPRPQQTRVVAVCNQKGGCGKTTSVINVAAGLAAAGQRVLVVDLDSQCNATAGLGIDVDEVETSIFDLLVDPKATSIEDVILESEYENLHIAPGSIELSEFESRVATEIGRENRLKKAFAPLLPYYDFILIDTPPSLGLLSVNALNAATEVFIAMQAHPFAFDGLNLLLNTIHLVQEELNRKLEISGIIVTMFDPRTKISKEIVEQVCAMEDLRGAVFKTVIRQNVKLTEATKMRKPIMYYDATCFGAEDYTALCREVCSQHATAGQGADAGKKSRPAESHK